MATGINPECWESCEYTAANVKKEVGGINGVRTWEGSAAKEYQIMREAGTVRPFFSAHYASVAASGATYSKPEMITR